MLLALALRDEMLGGAEAAEMPELALDLVRTDRAFDPPAALDVAKRAGR